MILLAMLGCGARCGSACEAAEACGIDRDLCVEACHNEADDDLQNEFAACLRQSTCSQIDAAECMVYQGGCWTHLVVVEGSCIPEPVQLLVEKDCLVSGIWEADFGPLGPPTWRADGRWSTPGFFLEWEGCSFDLTSVEPQPCLVPPTGEICSVVVRPVF